MPGGRTEASAPTDDKKCGKTGRRGNRRSAASGGRSELISRKCPDWRPQQWPGIGWLDGGQPPPPTDRVQEVRWAGDRKGRPYGGACVYIIYLYNKAVFFCDVKKIFCRRGKSAAKEGDFQMGSGGVRTGKVSPCGRCRCKGAGGIRALFYADRLRCFLLFAPNRYRAAG